MIIKPEKYLILESLKEMIKQSAMSGNPMTAEEMHQASNMEHGQDAQTNIKTAEKATIHRQLMGLDHEAVARAKEEEMKRKSQGLSA